MAWSKRRWCISENRDRFFSDSRLGTDADATVRPLHAETLAIPRPRRCRGIAPSAISDRQRAEEQLVLNQRRESRRSLDDDGLDGLVPPVAFPAHRLCRVVFARQNATSDDAASTRACLFHHAHMTLTVCARGVLSGCCCRPYVGESWL